MVGSENFIIGRWEDEKNIYRGIFYKREIEVIEAFEFLVLGCLVGFSVSVSFIFSVDFFLRFLFGFGERFFLSDIVFMVIGFSLVWFLERRFFYCIFCLELFEGECGRELK